MDIPHTKHIHSPSWDQQTTGTAGRRRDAAHTLHTHQHSGSDSFFNRVFGHHSSADSSRGKKKNMILLWRVLIYIIALSHTQFLLFFI